MDGDIPEGDYVKDLPVVRSLAEQGGLAFRSPVTFLVGADAGVSSAPGALGDGSVPLHEQSRSEAFLAIMENRFGGHGIYVLDEPETALSPMRLMRLMALMARLVEESSQFIVSTHSPMLMVFPGAEVLLIDAGGIRPVDFLLIEGEAVPCRTRSCNARYPTAEGGESAFGKNADIDRHVDSSRNRTV